MDITKLSEIEHAFRIYILMRTVEYFKKVELQEDSAANYKFFSDLFDCFQRQFPECDLAAVLRSSQLMEGAKSLDEMKLRASFDYVGHLLVKTGDDRPDDVLDSVLSTLITTMENVIEDMRDEFSWDGDRNHDVYADVPEEAGVYFITPEGQKELKFKFG